MGQKVNPLSLRLPKLKNWQSRWFAEKEYGQYLIEDIKIRQTIAKKLGLNAAIEKVDIERSQETVTVKIYTARPGIIIGRSGQGINDLKNYLESQPKLNTLKRKLKLEIIEVKIPELSANLVAQNIGSQISRRISFRRAIKQAIEKTIEKGAKGIKVCVSGRLGGAEIARTEKFGVGEIPLGSIRADIDYALYHAHTTYGMIGIKVWLYKGIKHEEK